MDAKVNTGYHSPLFDCAERIADTSAKRLTREKPFSQEMWDITRVSDALCFKESQPLEVVYIGGKLHQISIPEINVISIGETPEEAIADFKETIEHMWKFYGGEDDGNLTEGAIRIKRWLLEKLEEK